jgi:AraC-like DNA-binding protein
LRRRESRLTMARGRIRWRWSPVADSRAMKPTVYRPQGALSNHVEYFWSWTCHQDDAALTLKILANGVSGIIFQHHNGRSVLRPTTAHRVSMGAIPVSFVYGKRTRPAQISATGPVELTGVVLKSQALGALLNADPVQFNNGPVKLDDLSREHVGERLLNAGSQHERLVRLSEFLRARIDGSRPEDMVVAESLRLIHQGLQSIRVPRLLKRLNVSERQFERRFVRAVGVPPHQYIRIIRFQEAVRLIKTRRFERLSDVAHHLDYADQSHFVKEMKEFSGDTPTNLVRTLQACVDLPCALIVAQAATGSSAKRRDVAGNAGSPESV